MIYVLGEAERGLSSILNALAHTYTHADTNRHTHTHRMHCFEAADINQLSEAGDGQKRFELSFLTM